MGSLRATAVLLAATSLAQAQPNKPPTQSQIQQASDLTKKAIAKSSAGDHTLAIELYQQAYNIAPNAIILSNIGAEYEQAGKAVEAVTYFCKYLTEEPNGSLANFATTHVKSLQSQLGNETEDGNACKVKPKPVVAAPTPPAVTTTPTSSSEPPSTSPAFGETGGPQKDSPEHPGRTLVISGVAVAVVGAVVAGLGVHYALEGRALQNDIDSHDKNMPWPTEYEGVPIANWNSQGHTWNVDAALYGAIGGAVVITGAIMIGIGASKHAAHDSGPGLMQAHLVPTAGTHDGGLALVGSF